MKKIAAMVACAALCLLVSGCSAGGGSQPSQPAEPAVQQSQDAPSASAESSVSTADEIRAFSKSEWNEYFMETLKDGDEAIANDKGIEEGDGSTPLFYAARTQRLLDDFPEYSGSNEDVEKFYSTVRRSLEAYNESMSCMCDVADAFAKRDPDEAKSKTEEAKRALKEHNDLLVEAGEIANEITSG